MAHRALIVEPNPRTGVVLSDMASREDWTAFIYSSVEDALAGAQSDNFSIVMLDLDALGTDAPQRVEQAGALWGRAMLSVMASGEIAPELQGALEAAGITNIVRKPFNREKLRGLLNEARARAASRMSVVVIEDSRTVRSFIEMALKPLNCDVRTFETMEAALQSIAQHAPQLVISDIFMPGMGGVEGIQRIRQICPDVPCIAISGGYKDMTREKVLEAAKKIGANAALPKPFSAEALQSEVRDIVKG